MARVKHVAGKCSQVLRLARRSLLPVGLVLLTIATIGELVGADWIGEQVSQLGLVLILGGVLLER